MRCGEIVDRLQRDASRRSGRHRARRAARGCRPSRRRSLMPRRISVDLGGARRSLDAGQRDRAAAGLRQRHGGDAESLALPARLLAGRNDLGNGSERNADHRQSRRDRGKRRRTLTPPRNATELFADIDSTARGNPRQSPGAIVGCQNLAIFSNVSTRSHWSPAAVTETGPSRRDLTTRSTE